MVASAASIARPSRLLVLVLGLVTNTRGLGPAYAGDKFVRFKVGKARGFISAIFPLVKIRNTSNRHFRIVSLNT